MIPYGGYKRGGGKLHPHNECDICSEKTILKKRERQKARVELKRAVEEEVWYNDIKEVLERESGNGVQISNSRR